MTRAAQGGPVRTGKSHAFDWVLRCGAVACSRCGLVKLSNEMTMRAIKAPCPGRD